LASLANRIGETLEKPIDTLLNLMFTDSLSIKRSDWLARLGFEGLRSELGQRVLSGLCVDFLRQQCQIGNFSSFYSIVGLLHLNFVVLVCRMSSAASAHSQLQCVSGCSAGMRGYENVDVVFVAWCSDDVDDVMKPYISVMASILSVPECMIVYAWVSSIGAIFWKISSGQFLSKLALGRF